MAGAVLERQLTERRLRRVHFRVATEADDADLRRLLRENPIPGPIALSLEREPDYFADRHLPDEVKQTIMACENGRVVCVGNCVIRPRFINGQPRRVGYLGGLRLEARQAGRFDVLRRGYEFFRELQTERPADFYFTSIASANERARRFLERGLPGMPRYEFIGEFVTLLLATTARASVGVAPECGRGPVDAFLGCLCERNRLYQFAPYWSTEEWAALETLGVKQGDFHFVRRDGQLVAGAALWDQRCYKQTVVRSYSAGLERARPVLNLLARLLGTPRLPKPGATLANAFLSHLVDSDEPEGLLALISTLCRVALGRKIGVLTLGFAAMDPRLDSLRRCFRCREYRSRLYVVRWPKMGGAASELDGRVLAPEVALL